MVGQVFAFQEMGDALDYLRGRQSFDGDIGGFAVSAWVVMALAASGEDPHEWRADEGAPSIIDYLRDNSHMSDKPTDYERFILALTAAKENPRSFGGVDYLSKLMGYYDGGQIGDKELLNDDFWGVLALVSAGERRSQIVQASVEYIVDNQNNDGGWSFAIGRTSDVDDTAAAVMALISAEQDPGSEAIKKAVSYLKASQRDDGGLPWDTVSDASNALSTSWAVGAITAAGEDPTAAKWTVNNRNPIDFLLSLQDADGAFKWTATSRSRPEYTTSCVIPALLGKSYPIVIDPKVTVRVEGEDSTIWSGTVSLSGDFTFTAHNSGNTYTMSAESPLGALEAASNIGGFSYTVNDQWYPPDLFVNDIEGETSWMFRVNGVSPWYGAGYSWLASGPALSNGDEILWYYTSTWMERPLRISVSETQVYVAETFTVTVTTTEEDYYHDPANPWPNVNWVPVSDATVHADKDYLTDTNGEALITIETSGTYNVYAEKDSYIRSGKTQIHVEEGKPPIPCHVWLEVDKAVAPLGDSVVISGRRDPEEQEFNPYRIHLYWKYPWQRGFSKAKLIETFPSDENGTFTYEWTPSVSGNFEIFGYASGHFTVNSAFLKVVLPLSGVSTIDVTKAEFDSISDIHSVNITLRNNDQYFNHEFVLLIQVKNDGVVTSITYVTDVIPRNQSKSIAFSVEGSKIEIYIWKSLDTPEPLTKMVILNAA
ncbi:MAG: hypothetical protein GTN80_03895 [Nitrososphaeria archaeon]|nr:hypothetical protein [Nitrososphaeria archaeon]NIN52293.1 hypothetical protein [Nitrososphaeria archaeon]NIQ32771.1 hypothetical protein [Nitrososphaeria archaeon]